MSVPTSFAGVRGTGRGRRASARRVHRHPTEVRVTRRASRAPATTVRGACRSSKHPGSVVRNRWPSDAAWAGKSSPSWSVRAPRPAQVGSARAIRRAVESNAAADGQCSGGQAADSKAAQYQPVDRSQPAAAEAGLVDSVRRSCLLHQSAAADAGEADGLQTPSQCVRVGARKQKPRHAGGVDMLEEFPVLGHLAATGETETSQTKADQGQRCGFWSGAASLAGGCEAVRVAGTDITRRITTRAISRDARSTHR